MLKRPSIEEINLPDLLVAISHVGYGSGDLATHPCSVHNLIKMKCNFKNVSDRKSNVTWVGPSMSP
jgi:hypothetical protein